MKNYDCSENALVSRFSWRFGAYRRGRYEQTLRHSNAKSLKVYPYSAIMIAHDQGTVTIDDQRW